jgi:SAM-dependent methyltransferase
VFSREKNVLEIGPGYGRLLKACLQHKVPFKNYFGVDISLQNIEWLQQNFPLPNVRFIHGDVETISFEDRFDIVLSSLTFEHLFPSFEKALKNVVNYVNPSGMFLFDLIEGERAYFEDDGVTYIRHYTRQEIVQILHNASLELVAFDEVWHDPDHPRLLVMARKPEQLSYRSTSAVGH